MSNYKYKIVKKSGCPQYKMYRKKKNSIFGIWVFIDYEYNLESCERRIAQYIKNYIESLGDFYKEYE